MMPIEEGAVGRIESLVEQLDRLAIESAARPSPDEATG
jgi:hypothetical protein